MKRTIAVFAGLLAAGVLFAYIIHLTPHGATMLFVNARVYTLDPGNTVCQAVAVRDDRIIDLGSTQELRYRYPDSPVTDLHGKTVLPGLIDAHAHIRGLGQLLHSVILVGAPSGEEAAGFVGERAKAIPPGQWIYGRGWDQNLWKNKQFPTARMLDAAAPANPVILIRIDGHAIWVNTRAMELAGVTRKTTDPPGGKIIRLPDGSPSGVFVDDARDLIERYAPKLTREELQLRLSDALRECARQGLTEVGDMGVDSLQIELYREMADRGELPIRLYAAIDAPSPTWNRWAGLPRLIGYARGLLTVRAVKLYADGALGSRGAALVEEYTDDPGNRGLTTISDSELVAITRQATEGGYQTCVHAIGDRGNHIVLGSFEKVLRSVPAGDYRPRIEHAQVLLPGDIPRFAQLGVIPSMQPVHAVSDMPWAEDRLGPVRIRGAYAWRSLMNSGSIIAGGSDFPNDIVNPLWGIYAAMTRSDGEGNPPGGWYPEQKLKPAEAFKCFTVYAAYSCFQEHLKGSIEKGKWADMTVFSNDIVQVPPRELLATEVEMTVVGGKIVFSKSAPAASR